jgi:Uma2 family endonuclease
MVLIQSPPQLSLSEFLELPETKPASEYIDGKIYQKLMPKGKHSAIQTFFPISIEWLFLSELLVHLPNRAVLWGGARSSRIFLYFPGSEFLR